MQDAKSKKAKAKGTSGREDKSSVRWSPVKGVQMLELNKMHMFHLIRAQFTTVSYGRLRCYGAATAEQYLSNVTTTNREYAKLFGDIESIYDIKLKLRL